MQKYYFSAKLANILQEYFDLWAKLTIFAAIFNSNHAFIDDGLQ